MKQINISILSLVVAVFTLYAETSDYQRLDLELDKNKITIEGSVNYFTQKIEENNMYIFQPQVAVGYTLKKHGFRAELPYVLRAYNDQDARRHFFYGFGDMLLSYEYLKHIRHINLFFGGFWNIPLSENNEYMIRERILPSGSGRHGLGLSFSITGIKDPMVWTVGFKYGIGLPKKEHFYWSWEPGNIEANAGMITMLNDTFGVSLNIIQSINLPKIKDGRSDIEELRTATIFRPAFMMLNEDWYARITLDIPTYPLSMPFVLNVTYGYSFEFPNIRNVTNGSH